MRMEEIFDSAENVWHLVRYWISIIGNDLSQIKRITRDDVVIL